MWTISLSRTQEEKFANFLQLLRIQAEKQGSLKNLNREGWKIIKQDFSLCSCGVKGQFKEMSKCVKRTGFCLCVCVFKCVKDPKYEKRRKRRLKEFFGCKQTLLSVSKNDVLSIFKRLCTIWVTFLCLWNLFCRVPFEFVFKCNLIKMHYQCANFCRFAGWANSLSSLVS